MALTTSESITLMVNGTCASELRTRFWPIRFTYSVTTGSRTSFEVASTSCAYCLPMRISVSSEYQSPGPRPPTLRLPIALTSFLLPSCLTLLSSGCSTTGGGASAGLTVDFVSEALLSEDVLVGLCEVVVGVCELVVGLCDVEEESFPSGLAPLLVSVEDVLLEDESSWGLLVAVASGVEPALGSCCWASNEGATNNADNTTVPSTSRNFITHSCPDLRGPA